MIRLRLSEKMALGTEMKMKNKSKSMVVYSISEFEMDKFQITIVSQLLNYALVIKNTWQKI